LLFAESPVTSRAFFYWDWGRRRLLACAFGAILLRRPHAKDAKAPRTPREEKKGGELLFDRFSLILAIRIQKV
jgi:hypothetical protein